MVEFYFYIILFHIIDKYTNLINETIKYFSNKLVKEKNKVPKN